MDLSTGTQTSCLTRNSNIYRQFHLFTRTNRSSPVSLSFATSRKICRSILNFTSTKTNRSCFVGNVNQRNRFKYSFESKKNGDSDQYIELEVETTPLEAFFNRNSSLLESFEGNKIHNVIDGGIISGNSSGDILVVLGSFDFVNQLSRRCPEASIEVVHFSLDVLTDIKVDNDDVRCFHINSTDFSEIEGSFDTIFLNYYPIFSNSLQKLLKSVAQHCKPGATVTISFAQDRKHILSLASQSGGILKSSLPERNELSNALSTLPFEIISFQDGTNFYLSTLKFTGAIVRGGKARADPAGFSKENKYPIYVSGEVIYGYGRGSKQLGFPTANLSVENLPLNVSKLTKGVYYGFAQVIGSDVGSDVYHMVMNLGDRPTFDKDGTLSLEVHILHDYGVDFYGKQMRIAIWGFIREEMQFSSVDDLKRRITNDIGIAQKHLSKIDFDSHQGNVFFSY